MTIFHNHLMKNQVFSPLGPVTCARREITLLDANMLYGTHSALDTPLFIIYSWCMGHVLYKKVKGQ